MRVCPATGLCALKMSGDKKGSFAGCHLSINVYETHSRNVINSSEAT